MSRTFRQLLAPAILIAGTSLLSAQTKPAETGPAATKPVSELKITLMDGSLLSGKLSISELAIDTKFGPLKVPMDQIQSFAPGLQSHVQFQQTLNGLIADLAADAFADREKAQTALLKLGPGIKPELERQLKGAENEKAMRLQKILEEFDAQTGDDDEKPTTWAKDDTIITAGFIVVGHITTPGFKLTTTYGDLQIKLEDVREVKREAAEPEDIRKNIAITGIALSQKVYSNTGIKVVKGDQINITASGTITMTPWGSDQQSTPDGQSNFGQLMPGVYGGTLIARIGDGGSIVKVGTKATFVADRAGVLQLGIAMPNNYPNNQFPGEYQAKIRVVKK